MRVEDKKAAGDWARAASRERRNLPTPAHLLRGIHPRRHDCTDTQRAYLRAADWGEPYV